HGTAVSCSNWMTQNHSFTTTNGMSQEQSVHVTVDLRRHENTLSRIRAHADVEIRINGFGSIQIFGFSIFEPDGKPLVVLRPAQKGEKKSLPHLKLLGKVKTIIESTILREYQEVNPNEEV